MSQAEIGRAARDIDREVARVGGAAEEPRWPLKSKQMVTPLGDRYLVLLEPKAEHKVGGTGVSIVLPEQARERPDAAVVISVGPGVSGDVEVGARVLVSRYGGVDVQVEGNRGKFLVVRESDLLGVVEDLDESYWPQVEEEDDPTPATAFGV